jgi:L-iditol 2-dehydrogenase
MKKTMQAAVWHGPGRENFRLERWPRPNCGAHDVIIKVSYCFFSAMYARAILVGHPQLRGPTVLGRMLAGEIVEVGAAVDRELRPGMRVTVNPEWPCSGCFYCLRGMPGHCIAPTKLEPGGMAEFVRVPAPLVAGIYPLPADVQLQHAAFSETLACVLQGLEVADIRPADTVVILGAGGVGLCFLQLARLRGASRVFVGIRRKRGLDMLSRLGADHVFTGSVEALRRGVAEETGGHGADVVIEATGAVEMYMQALELLRCGGTAVGFGGLPPGSRFPLDPNLLHYRSLRFIGSYRYRPDHFCRSVELVSSGRINLHPVVTDVVRFDRVTEDALALQQNPECRALVVDIDS